DKYLDEVTLWKMSKKAGKQVDYFHINEKINYKNGKKYYDKSCLTGDCFTSISHNVEGTFKTFSKNSKNYLYIVRNFNYMNFLKQNKVKQARAELIEINSMVNYFQKIAQKSSDVLVLISSAGAIDLEFPTSGKQWKDYERGKRKLRINNSKLLSSVYASGARAENFCGIFDQNQILSRIFSGSKQQGLEFSIINPFK
ncbi:MAG: hypothetical protein HON90_11915, partial [Halobacteriovoraceae bacterium]|nr:hypothetical protein [Halobacteriovoraceae bacterium]